MIDSWLFYKHGQGFGLRTTAGEQIQLAVSMVLELGVSELQVQVPSH